MMNENDEDGFFDRAVEWVTWFPESAIASAREHRALITSIVGYIPRIVIARRLALFTLACVLTSIVAWALLGSSGLGTRPGGLVILRYCWPLLAGLGAPLVAAWACTRWLERARDSLAEELRPIRRRAELLALSREQALWLVAKQQQVIALYEERMALAALDHARDARFDPDTTAEPAALALLQRSEVLVASAKACVDELRHALGEQEP